MTSTANHIGKSTNGHIKPFKVKQALIGLSLDNTDGPVLKYFGTFTEKIPTKAACFVHVIPFVQLFEMKSEKERLALEHYKMGDEVVETITSKIANEVAPHHVKVNIEVEEGNPLDELLAKAESLGADLIVIGKDTGSESHGILAKNFARKVQGHALVVPVYARPVLENILVPFDFSPNAIEALRMAVAIAKNQEKPLVITALNVFEMPSMQAYLLRKTVDEMLSLLIEDRKEAFATFLDTYIPEEDRKYIKTEIIEQTQPGVGNLIMEFAREHTNHLIVMGARGHSKIGLLLLGSVTEKVLSITKDIPVLIVNL